MTDIKRRYKKFHGYDPDLVEQGKLWVPGSLVCIGTCIDTGYAITAAYSSKDGLYVHDHKDGVLVYRPAKQGEEADVSYSRFPSRAFVLGSWLGCTYLDHDGAKREVKGSNKLRATTPDGKRLVIIHPDKGVVYLIKGGKFRITDWMYN